MLAYDYCARPGRLLAAKDAVREAVPARQTKRILDALLASNWDGPANRAYNGPFTPVYPFYVVQQLQLDEASMKSRPDITGLATRENVAAYRRWLQGVRDTARIQRLVAK
jgi:hypothetical protein